MQRGLARVSLVTDMRGVSLSLRQERMLTHYRMEEPCKCAGGLCLLELSGKLQQ